MDQEKNIYDKLRQLRRSRGITVNKLAEKIGENYQKVGRIERGRRSITIDYLMKISKALDAPLEDLLDKDLESIPNEKKEKAQSSSLLNLIIVQLERCSFPLSVEQKGRLVSKVFDLAQEFFIDHQEHFIEAFFEGLSVLKSDQ